MAGNSFGELFRVTTWGESHGEAVGAVVDGCPAGIDLTPEDINRELERRRPGKSPGSSPRCEKDQAVILSGVFAGRTTGTPISILIENRDADSTPYERIKDIFRPGTGDYTYFKKYGLRDHRGGGRSSARETAARVAAGAVAEKIIARAGIEVLAFTRAIGTIEVTLETKHVTKEAVAGNPLFCPEEKTAVMMEEALAQARADGDSLGGVVEVIVRGCPAGLGEPVFDKIDADLARALMSIGSVKGVEIGAGFSAARMRGSEANDQMTADGFLTNHAGGILAGITSGEAIILRAACKPIPSIALPQRTIDIEGKEVEITIAGRHDVCALPRVVVVCEAMVKIVLADHLLRQGAGRWR